MPDSWYIYKEFAFTHGENLDEIANFIKLEVSKYKRPKSIICDSAAPMVINELKRR
jgi:hypothetical protein